VGGGRAADSAATTPRIRGRRSRGRSTRLSSLQATTNVSGSSSRSAPRPPTRMVGEPTTFTAAWFDAFPEAADAAPLLARARSLKTEQELERLRLANELAAAAMGPRPRAAPAGDEGGAGRRALAGLRARRGHGLPRPGRARAPVLADLGRARDQDLHRHRRSARRRGRARPVSRSGSAPTVTGPTTRRTSSSAS